MTTTLDRLPDSARLWVFVTARLLTGAEQRAVRAVLDAFTSTWTSHSRPVEAAADVAEGRFLLVAAQLPGGDVSGCGIDKLVHAVEQALAVHGTALASGLDVPYRTADGSVEVASRAELKARVLAGALDADTPVFDASTDMLGALRSGRFERPLGVTWVARYLPTTA